ncbi:MAG: hypothetical protein KBF75_12220 [Saprospiraceae bacterium]|nr:hypothetical protein [Saprospiraceae bacterium]
MRFFKIMPEVPASFGQETVFERVSGAPLKVTKVQLIFDGWLENDLMETSPIYYITVRLKCFLHTKNLSGIESFEIIEALKSETFLELYPEKKLPTIYQIKINGNPFVDDFGINNGYLIISEKVKNYLAEFNVSCASFEEIEPLST